MNSRYLQQVVNNDMAQNSEPDTIYMDVNVINNNLQGVAVPLTYSETRDRPIINCCNEYYLSVIRFNLDTLSLPVFIPQIQLNQSDINLSIYSFTFEYDGVNHQQYLEFVPQDKTAQLPSPPQDNVDLTTGYYYLYSFQWFVDILNVTLKDAYAGFISALTDAGKTAPAAENIPFIMYDPTTSEMILNLDAASFDDSLETPCFLYCNSAMRNLLCGFNMEIDNYTDANGMNYKIVCENRLSTNVLQVTDTYTAIQCYQEFTSTSKWSCVQSVVLTTNMPIVGTIQGIPQVFGSETSLTNSSANVSLNVISDFEVQLSNGKEWLPNINYVPQIYRLVPMVSNNALHTVDITAYWKDIYNNLHQFNISANTNCNIKLMFRKKYLGV
jgi:hypothetical protein